ncbi:hypothetical protein V8C44DRAFT_25149 [Trichoderma aethiopicum]
MATRTTMLHWFLPVCSLGEVWAFAAGRKGSEKSGWVLIESPELGGLELSGAFGRKWRRQKAANVRGKGQVSAGTETGSKQQHAGEAAASSRRASCSRSAVGTRELSEDGGKGKMEEWEDGENWREEMEKAKKDGDEG